MRRKEQREQAFFLIFESQFNGHDPEAAELYNENNDEKLSDYALMLYNGVCEKEDELDEIIAKYSKGWKINRISKVNIAILRLAVYELKYVDEVPPSVSINEAVELAKTYSTKEDSAFINGVLGSFVREK